MAKSARASYRISRTAPPWARKTIQLLESRGAPRSDLLELFEISPPTLGHKLAGRVDLSTKELQNLAGYLDTSIDWLMSEDDQLPEAIVKSIQIHDLACLPCDDPATVDEGFLTQEPTAEELSWIAERINAEVDPTDKIAPPKPVSEDAFAVRVRGSLGEPEVRAGDILIIDGEPRSGDRALLQQKPNGIPALGQFVATPKKRQLITFKSEVMEVDPEPALFGKIIAIVRLEA